MLDISIYTHINNNLLELIFMKLVIMLNNDVVIFLVKDHFHIAVVSHLNNKYSLVGLLH